MSNERLVQIVETLAGQMSMTLAKAKTVYPEYYPSILSDSLTEDSVMKLFDAIASMERRMFRIDMSRAFDDAAFSQWVNNPKQDFDLSVAEDINNNQDAFLAKEEPVEEPAGFNWTLLKNVASLSKAPIGIGMLIGDVKFNEVRFIDIDGECWDIVEETLDWTTMIEDLTGLDLRGGRLTGIIRQEMDLIIDDDAIYTEESFVYEFRSRAVDVILAKGGQSVYDKLLAFFEITDMEEKPMSAILDVCHARYLRWKATGEPQTGDEYPEAQIPDAYEVVSEPMAYDDEYDDDDSDEPELSDLFETSELDYLGENDLGLPILYDKRRFEEFSILTQDITNFVNASNRVYDLCQVLATKDDISKVATELGRYYPEFGNQFAANIVIMYNRIRALTKTDVKYGVSFQSLFDVSQFERNFVTLIVQNYVVTKWVATFRSFDMQKLIDMVMEEFGERSSVRINTDQIISFINSAVYGLLNTEEYNLFTMLDSAIPERLHEYSIGLDDKDELTYEVVKNMLGDELATVIDGEHVLLRGGKEDEVFMVRASRKPELSLSVFNEEQPYGMTVKTDRIIALLSAPFDGNTYILDLQKEEIERNKRRAINNEVTSFMQDYFYPFAPPADGVRDDIIEELKRGGPEYNDVSEVIHRHLQGQKQQYTGDDFDIAYSFIMASVVIKRMTDVVNGDYRLSSIKKDDADENIAVLFNAKIMPAMIYFVLKTSPIIYTILRVSGFHIGENVTVVDNLGRLSLSISQYLVSHGLLKPTHDMIELVDMIVDAFGIYLLDGLKLVHGNDVTYIDDRINHKLVNWVSNNVYLSKLFNATEELKTDDTKAYEALVKMLENPDTLLSFASLYENKLTTELEPGKLYKVNTSKGDVCLVYNDIRNAYTVLYKDDAYTCLERIRTKYKPTSIMTLIKHLVYGEKNK